MKRVEYTIYRIKELLKKAKELLKSADKKRMVVAALFLVTGLLFAIAFDAYGKNVRFHKVKDSVESVETARKMIELDAHIRELQMEDTETRVEKMTRVTTTIATGKRANTLESPLEEPVEEVIEEEEQDPEEEVVEEETTAEVPEEETEETPEETKKDKGNEENGDYYSSSDLQFMGEIYSGGYRWTWYSQNVLPGGGLDIPGRHVDENGYVCDENGRICLASSDYGYGTVVPTPFGKEGCVYDSGCDSGTLDVYVDF